MTERFDSRWTMDCAQAWHEELPWLVGANYIPRNAVNQLEMWQADTFSPEVIDEELAWAADLGYNCMRVYLHDLVWEQDSIGFCSRIDTYLEIAGRYGIKTIFVLFDSVWDPCPKPGPQLDPIPGVHNSRWVQGPHIDILKDETRHRELIPYISGVMGRYAEDDRVILWDLLNEPGNRIPAYREHDPDNKMDLCHAFLKNVFVWARAARPSQPLTGSVWREPGEHIEPVQPLDALMLDNSDVITFHMYTPLDKTQAAVEWLQQYDRLLICTEYMARSEGSTFQEILPYFKDQKIGAIQWGFVSGRTQTICPWTSWRWPYDREPDPWFHDLLREDGTPFLAEETSLIRSLTGANC